MSENILEKILKAGIGAVMTVAEKTGEVVDDLAKKGEEPYQKAVQKGGEILEEIKSTFEKSGVCEKAEELFKTVESMSREELDCLKKVIREVEESKDAAEKKEEPCCCEDETCCCTEENCCCEDEACCRAEDTCRGNEGCDDKE